jgi:mono/diheme cytochrome c family protein
VKRWIVALGLILIFTGSTLAANADPQLPINNHLPSSIFHPLFSAFPPSPPAPDKGGTLHPSSFSSPSTVYTPKGTGRLPSTDDGAKLYEFWCSTCHGDRGQGLTAEWRAQWPEGKQNCWQAKCHAASHPPDGFSFPKQVPALIGPDTLAKFPTAQDLYVYARSAMPYWSPNLLTDDEYQAITIFLVKANYAARDLPIPEGLSQDLSIVSLSLNPQVGGTSKRQTEISGKREQLPFETITSATQSTSDPHPLTSDPQLAASSYLTLLWISLMVLGGIFAIFLVHRFSSHSQ